MQNILLLTDFSESSKNAINYTLQLLQSKTIQFHLVYVHKASAFTSADLMTTGNANLYASIVKSPKEDLEDLAAALHLKYKNDRHTFLTHIDYDVFTDAVNQIITQNAIDLVVMGTNGVTGADEVVFGSHTLHVIRNVSCPTLIIPKHFKFSKPETVLIPLDEKDVLNKKRLQQVTNLVDKHTSKYDILRITETANSDQEDLKLLNKLLQSNNFIYHQVVSVPMHHVVDTYLQTNPIDFEVFIIQKTSFLERLFKGSPITKHSKIASVPLFVLHD